MSGSGTDGLGQIRLFLRLGYWTALFGGLLLPWLIMIGFDHLVRHVPWEQAWHAFRLHLFAPGYNFFLIGILNGVPFILWAIWMLFHLGRASLSDALTLRRRAGGLALAGLAMTGLSLWTHTSVLLYPDAQGALAYLFLPVVLVLASVGGYGIGRLLARRLV